MQKKPGFIQRLSMNAAAVAALAGGGGREAPQESEKITPPPGISAFDRTAQLYQDSVEVAEEAHVEEDNSNKIMGYATIASIVAAALAIAWIISKEAKGDNYTELSARVRKKFAKKKPEEQTVELDKQSRIATITRSADRKNIILKPRSAADLEAIYYALGQHYDFQSRGMECDKDGDVLKISASNARLSSRTLFNALQERGFITRYDAIVLGDAFGFLERKADIAQVLGDAYVSNTNPYTIAFPGSEYLSSIAITDNGKKLTLSVPDSKMRSGVFELFNDLEKTKKEDVVVSRDNETVTLTLTGKTTLLDILQKMIAGELIGRSHSPGAIRLFDQYQRDRLNSPPENSR